MMSRLQEPWLGLMRSAWVLLAIAILLLLALGAPFEYTYYKSICLGAVCPTDTLAAPLTPEDVQILQRLGLSAGFYAAYMVILEVVAVFVYGVIGALIFWHRSTDSMAIFAAFTLLAAGCAIFFTGQLVTHVPLLWGPATWMNILGQASFGVFFLLFPDGRFVPPWTRWLAVGSSGWWAITAFAPNFPLSFNGPAFFGLIASLVVVQIYRYQRVSNAVQRQQTRWVVYGFAVAIMGFAGAIGVSVLNELVLASPPPGPVGRMIATSILNGFLLLIPLSIGMAILRSRLFDIDIIIRRTLVYAVLTLALGAVYLVSVIGLQALFVRLTGQQSALAVVVATLGAAALFQPLRRRVQAFIDRRFFRTRYDARLVLEQFARRVQSEADLDTLAADIRATVQETLEPEQVQIWLRR